MDRLDPRARKREMDQMQWSYVQIPVHAWKLHGAFKIQLNRKLHTHSGGERERDADTGAAK